MSIHVIGDVHAHYNRYKTLTEQFPFTVQLGDFGFNYRVFDYLDKPDNHVFFGGNHDNYDVINQCPNNLGDYGLRIHNSVPFYFVRGAWSIDRKWRTTGIDLWEAEQLSVNLHDQIVENYLAAKPDIVITHDAPYEVTKLIFGTDGLYQFGWPRTLITDTGHLLQRMFDIHKPKKWFFGHFHQAVQRNIFDTEFTCVPELGVIEVT